MTKSQNQSILNALQAGPITAMDALQICGCFRLSARIYDLRQEGHNIVAQTIEHRGKKFAQYTLVRAKQ